MTAPARRFAGGDHHCVWILDYYTGWFDHLGERLRAAAPSFDPEMALVLLRRLEALDVGYQFAHEPSELRYRDAEEERAAVAVLSEIHDYTRAAFAAGRTALADDMDYRPFWLLCGVSNPFPHRDVLIAAAGKEPVCFVDLHDREDVGSRELRALADLEQIVVLDLGATDLTNALLGEIAFGALLNLRALDLSENPITALPTGLTAAGALESLDLRKTRMPAEAVAELRRARPGLHVRY